MYIRDMLARGLTVSCELFPPKKGSELAGAMDIVERTARLAPDFISVTCGASGSTSRSTAQLASRAQRFGVPALAHITCVSSARDEIGAILGDIKARGIGNILALRGDLPEGTHAPGGGFAHACDLVAEIHRHGGFCIGGACYPEGHVESRSQSEDIDHLKQKADAGCDFLTTQMFFDNNILYRFLYRLHSKGINLPVLAGIMPVTNRKQIKRIVELSGTSLPPRFLSILDRFGDNDAAMEQAGVAYATEQIIDLIANGVSGVHIYTMNRPAVAGKIMSGIGDIIAHCRTSG